LKVALNTINRAKNCLRHYIYNNYNQRWNSFSDQQMSNKLLGNKFGQSWYKWIETKLPGHRMGVFSFFPQWVLSSLYNVLAFFSHWYLLGRDRLLLISKRVNMVNNICFHFLAQLFHIIIKDHWHRLCNG
jgi:hypothetical protein